MPSKPSQLLLPVIVFAQFAGTSLWFAGNAVITHLLPASQDPIANITSIVQFGFIAGTLVFSILTIADRFQARRVFLFSALVAAAANLLITWTDHATTLYILRFITGFFLAGIYPVGMKIAADYFPEKLGNALGFLVGALVIGTAFPHLLRSGLQDMDWKQVLVFTSLLAISGALLLFFITPVRKTQGSTRWNYRAAADVFRSAPFRGAAFGYFGHMWELYAFWAFVPVLIRLYNEYHSALLNEYAWTFIIIASGALGCIAGGILSKKYGSRHVAYTALLISGICCLLSPLLFLLPPAVFLSVLVLWGITVVADSPQFSALVAKFAPVDNKGTALTIVTSVGFAITIVSIQVLQNCISSFDSYGWLVLVPGPVAGLLFIRKYLPSHADRKMKEVSEKANALKKNRNAAEQEPTP